MEEKRINISKQIMTAHGKKTIKVENFGNNSFVITGSKGSLDDYKIILEKKRHKRWNYGEGINETMKQNSMKINNHFFKFTLKDDFTMNSKVFKIFDFQEL